MPTTDNSIKCPRCFAAIAPEAQFCPRCGAAVEPHQRASDVAAAPPGPRLSAKPTSPWAGILFLAGFLVGPALIVGGYFWEIPLLLYCGIAICVIVGLLAALGSLL